MEVVLHTQDLKRLLHGEKLRLLYGGENVLHENVLRILNIRLCPDLLRKHVEPILAGGPRGPIPPCHHDEEDIEPHGQED